MGLATTLVTSVRDAKEAQDAIRSRAAEFLGSTGPVKMEEDAAQESEVSAMLLPTQALPLSRFGVGRDNEGHRRIFESSDQYNDGYVDDGDGDGGTGNSNMLPPATQQLPPSKLGSTRSVMDNDVLMYNVAGPSRTVRS